MFWHSLFYHLVQLNEVPNEENKSCYNLAKHQHDLSRSVFHKAFWDNLRTYLQNVIKMKSVFQTCPPESDCPQCQPGECMFCQCVVIVFPCLVVANELSEVLHSTTTRTEPLPTLLIPELALEQLLNVVNFLKITFSTRPAWCGTKQGEAVCVGLSYIINIIWLVESQCTNLDHNKFN